MMLLLLLLLCSVKFTHQFDTKQEKAQGDYNMMMMVSSSSSINPTAVAYFLLLSPLFFLFFKYIFFISMHQKQQHLNSRDELCRFKRTFSSIEAGRL